MPIDIVVPIYNAFDALTNCLKSLEKHQSVIKNVYLINDASPDNRIKQLINVFAKNNKWHVIHHQQNQGFVKTANEGLKLNTNHTVLLNSDTVVSKNWLIAFKDAIEKNNNLGTITAWSNNAEICSFPKFLYNNPLADNIDELSKILYEDYVAKYPEIPTAVGFCMLITKQAQLEVGYFDEKHFGHGYGEENDYSLRVKELGLKNILCDNAYVGHLGNKSFNEFGLQPNEDTMKRLLQKHPNYINQIKKYIDLDPLTKIRQEILSIIETKNSQMYKDLILV